MPEQPKIRDLNKLSQQEIQEIAQQNKGKFAFVIVHPYFETGKNAQFDNFLKARDPKVLTIILEEHGKAGETSARLNSLGIHSLQNIFIVRTKTNESTPIMGWQKFFTRVWNMKIIHVEIDGRNLEYNTREYIENRLLIAERLRKEMNLKLSSEKKPKNAQDQLKNIWNTRKRAFRGPNIPMHCVGEVWGRMAATGNFKIIINRRFG